MGISLCYSSDSRRGTMNWVGNSLDGYYAAVRKAIFVSLFLRTIFAGWLVRWIYRKVRKI